MCCYKFYTQTIRDELVEKIDELARENEISSHYEISDLSQNNTGHMYVFNYELNGEKETCDEGIAHVLSDMLQKQMIQKVCEQFLKRREDLTLEERKEIANAFMTNNYLSRQEGVSYVTYYLVYLPIYKEVKEKGGLNMEGWLRFRLGKYKILLTDVLEQFVEDYVAKKDVVNFIRIMREVNLLAVPLEEIVHIVCGKEGKVQIFDKNGVNVTGHYIKKYCKDLLLDSTLTREDLLLHVLITISPKKIILHKSKNMKSRQFINTLEIIFEDSITYCEGCEFCNKQE